MVKLNKTWLKPTREYACVCVCVSCWCGCVYECECVRVCVQPSAQRRWALPGTQHKKKHIEAKKKKKSKNILSLVGRICCPVISKILHW